MRNWKQINRETVDGFDIVLSIAPEKRHTSEHFNIRPDKLAQLCLDIEQGRYLWFVARVQAFRLDVELATDYLDGCVYKSPDEFMTGDPEGCYSSMVETVTIKARDKIKKLAASL